MRGRADVERIRVVRVITRLNVGGPALHASILSRDLDAARFETTLVFGRVAEGEAEMASLGRMPPGIRAVELPMLRREVAPLDDARALAALVALFRRVRPDVVHTHLAKAGSLGRLAARLTGVPVVVHTFHGSVFSGYFGSRGSRVYLAAERRLATITTRLIAISPAIRDELLQLRVAPAEKIALVPLGLDLAPFLAAPERGAARARLGLEAGGRYVALAGRLVPIKDVGTFLQAFALLAKGRPDLSALVAGDGPERASLERLAAELGIAKRCRFLGWVADMPALYAAADVVALSSRNEGTPVTLIEAMAAGRPVVATAVGGVPDVVTGAAGILVPPGRPDLLAAAMERSLTLVGGGEAARAAVHPRFAAARLVRDVESLYSELVAGTRAGRANAAR